MAYLIRIGIPQSRAQNRPLGDTHTDLVRFRAIVRMVHSELSENEDLNIRTRYSGTCNFESDDKMWFHHDGLNTLLMSILFTEQYFQDAPFPCMTLYANQQQG